MKKIIMQWALLAVICLGGSQFARAEVGGEAATPASSAVSTVTDGAVTADSAAIDSAAQEEALAEQKAAERLAKAEKKAAAAKKAAARFGKCDKCHEGEELMHGKHASATNPNTDLTVTCTNCHGHPAAKHRMQRRGVVDVMRFGDKAFPISQQNGVCMSCHTPDDLRKSLWAHDVHATNVTCTSCHQLHPTKDPMSGISEKSRIKLCVDCHGKQHEARQQAAVKEGE
ncbi:cytochrome c nitrite reductase pentaheme subunit [Aeromonas sp. MdU4]|uniref:cytochrome c nitrite reductase pentaheme subunit n=1 Tax=Aeromonas sp. MdU4 TaxID=3342819 RepID=UPI0035B9479B